MNEEIYVLSVYFKFGNRMDVALPKGQAVEIAECWASWAKLNQPDTFGFAGGLGWGFLFREMCGVNAHPPAAPEMTEAQKKLLAHQEKMIDMMKKEHGEGEDWKKNEDEQ